MEGGFRGSRGKILPSWSDLSPSWWARQCFRRPGSGFAVGVGFLWPNSGTTLRRWFGLAGPDPNWRHIGRLIRPPRPAGFGCASVQNASDPSAFFDALDIVGRIGRWGKVEDSLMSLAFHPSGCLAAVYVRCTPIPRVRGGGERTRFLRGEAFSRHSSSWRGSRGIPSDRLPRFAGSTIPASPGSPSQASPNFGSLPRWVVSPQRPKSADAFRFGRRNGCL